YNQERLNAVSVATLGDIVGPAAPPYTTGFNAVGSGPCGDFDPDESPFCNLVDPNWILKMPVTKCASLVKTEAYGELLKTNDGQRYGRCPDFASCLQEDGKGGCLGEEYGFCVKEKNVWQFGVSLCPADFSSCRSYKLQTQAGAQLVSYLKNTLSGSDICSSANAGCQYYLTKSGKADTWVDFGLIKDPDGQVKCEEKGGIWQDGECKAERIYLNRYAESCDISNEGCNEFSIYRDPATNLVLDSGFEYTEENKFPENWDLLYKQEVGENKPLADETACADFNQASAGCKNGNCTYYKTRLSYDYPDEIQCVDHNGQWIEAGFCSDGVSTDQASCVSPSQWLHCTRAINNDTTSTDCQSNGGLFKQYCLSSFLKYNLCENPKLTEQNTCLLNNGTWQTECQKNGQVLTEAEMQNEPNCTLNKGVWVQYCKGAKLYNSSQKDCQEQMGTWRGYGPFSDFATVSKDNTNTDQGQAKLQVRTGDLVSGTEFILLYKSKFPGENDLTKAGDVYTATASIKANRNLKNPVVFSLIGGLNDINSKDVSVWTDYNQSSNTLITANPGKELQLRLSLPYEQAGTIVYLDSFSFCHGYGPNDPPAKLDQQCQSSATCGYGDCLGGYWDTPQTPGSEPVYGTEACYKYKPDNPLCSKFMKVCEPEEAGCQIFAPVNGDPTIPGVVSLVDYCPAECVGYQTYKQEPTIYEPEPDPLFSNFIATTAKSCTVDEVGCSQFTNLDEVAAGGEGIAYYTYLRQCIKPNLNLGEKTFFTWQSSESGPPQLIKYQFQSDTVSGAPKTIDNSGDCRLTLGVNDFNCIKFFDSAGKEFNRDIRMTITVSDNCHPFRKTESTEPNCTATNGRWQPGLCQNNTDSTKETCEANNSAWTDGFCLYDAIPNEGKSCNSAVEGCRAYIGNRGNNIYIQFYDGFENDQTFDWYTGTTDTNTGDLERSSESVVLAGHSLAVPESINDIHKPVDIVKGNLYTLSFWAKTNSPTDKVLTINFSTNTAADRYFADQSNRKVVLTNTWQNYNLGPVYVDWDILDNNSLIFSKNLQTSKIYLDNIILRVVKDNVYVVKDSWNTPDSCNRTFYGAETPADEPPPMLGCQAYNDTLGQTHNLKSFSNLCRTSAVGCQILIDTQNSVNPNSQDYNLDNDSSLDDYQVPKDQLATYVLANDKICTSDNKGCQKLGSPTFELSGFTDVHLKNDPDKYINITGQSGTEIVNAIMCNEEALGCTELVNEDNNSEFYKIDPTKLCEYAKDKVVNKQTVSGWFKKGQDIIGCGALPYDNKDDCEKNNGAWSLKYEQCTFVKENIIDQDFCQSQGGEWAAPAGEAAKCLNSPFTIYKITEATKYVGYSGECDAKWNGCTEFVDFNPNFVANGGFEFLSEGALLPWGAITPEILGSYKVITDNVKEGGKALQLTKRTDKDANLDTYAFAQTIYGLNKGKTYKVDFYYKIPEQARGRGENCPLPKLNFEFNSLAGVCSASGYDNQASCFQNSGNWTSAPKGPRYEYTAEKDWKKAEILYTVPLGVCSDPTKITQKSCVSPNIWTELDSLHN
ncbi:MAG: carbohydrate binding domain-containing protein, partial [Candidatus Parcubacteria bacterium]|nr:carbohydrate binding domain-containing protein [Candidatus Parcubacteria bacterium]